MAIDAIPKGYTSVTPWIIGKDTAGLMDFLARAFGAEQLARLEQDGRIAHAEMRIGNAIVMMFDAPDPWPPTPAFLRLYLENLPATYDTALRQDATPITTPTPLAFGDTIARLRDPFGNLWWLQQRMEDVTPQNLKRRWSDPKWAQAMDYVQTSLTQFER